MPHSFRQRLQAYGVAVLSVAAALLLTWLLDPIANMTMTPFLLFSGAVVLAAWRGGVRAGLLATVLAALLSNYFFISPQYSFDLGPNASIRLFIFIVEAIAISVLCGSLRAAHRNLDASYLRLRDSEESLRHANQSITDILESVTDGFYALDWQWRFRYVNHQTERIFQRSRDELLGQSIWAVLPILKGSLLEQNFYRAVQEQRPIVFEAPGVVHPDRYFEIHINPLKEGLAVYFQDLTHRKQDERRLRQHMHMLDLANDSIIIRTLDDNTITYWNQGAARQYGWSVEAAMGKNIHHLLKTVFPEPIEAIQLAIAKQGCWAGELQQTRQDGRKIVVYSRWTLQKSLDGKPEVILEINHDITERQQAEEALRQSELHFRTLANTMPQIFWTAQPSGEIDYFNQRWYDYTGLSEAQSLGWIWQTVLHSDDLRKFTRTWTESVDIGQPVQLELRLLRASNGEYRWHLVRAFPLRDEVGKIVKWFGSSTDIHDQKMALLERDRALAQERAARAEAEAANRSKDEFLTVLSHELRTPLNPILGWTAMLRSRPLKESIRDRALEAIERNAKRQAQLIEDLLDVSRILRGEMTLDVDSVDLMQTINAAIDTVRLSANAKHISLQTDLDPTVSQVTGDQNRIQQIVWNLLSNAIKFTPTGGQVTVQLIAQDHCALIQVKDTGQGINPKFLPYVFERFHQADSSVTRPFGGLGLGLSIVRYLTELHGGTVKVESPGENQGSTFTVTLPVNHRTSILAPPSEGGAPINLAGIKAVVIDDDADLLQLLTMMLQDYNIEVLTAKSAQDGLQLVEHHHPDVLISDIGMPQIDGYALIHELRQRSEGKGGKIPAIALTAYTGETNREKVFQAGFQYQMAKPVDWQQLGLAISDLVNNANGSNGSNGSNRHP